MGIRTSRWSDRLYNLFVEGQTFSGSTGSAGELEHLISPLARSGRLIVGEPGKRQSNYALRISHLDPLSEVSGVQARLKNLGFGIQEVTGDLDDATHTAILAFQSKSRLETSGELDANTRAKLKESYGC